MSAAEVVVERPGWHLDGRVLGHDSGDGSVHPVNGEWMAIVWITEPNGRLRQVTLGMHNDPDQAQEAVDAVLAAVAAGARR